MGNIKVGDRVRIVKEYWGGIESSNDGKTGTVVKVTDNLVYPFFVKPDGWHHHTLDGILCQEVEPLVPEKQPVIIITSDGKTTIATKRLGKRVLGRCIAVCSDDDEYDYDTGASIAMARLIGAKVEFVNEKKEPQKPPKPENFTGKVVCLESLREWWTPGKTYDVFDGVIFDDDSVDRRRYAKDFDTFYASWWSGESELREARFAEVVERK